MGKLSTMEAAAFVDDFGTPLEFAPVNGHANEYVICSKPTRRNGQAEIKMTPADWDKFEQDITDAFEQVP